MQLVSLENEWLQARDAATLDQILASDFKHPVFTGDVLSKAQHVAWFMKHLPAAGIDRRFQKMEVRVYGDTGIVTGIVATTDERKKAISQTIFTDVFLYRGGRWQAISAQETAVTNSPPAKE